MQLIELLAAAKLSANSQSMLKDYGQCSLRDCGDDSRELNAGDLFLAYPGSSSDGRDYFGQALDSNVAAIIYQTPKQIELESKQSYFAKYAEICASRRVPFIALEDLAALAGALSARFYNNPGAKLTVIGITGTNGKTSVSTWVAEALSALGHRCAFMGTLGIGFPGDLKLTGLTTTGAVATQKHLHNLFRQGAEYVVMEVSSHALDQRRVDEVPFKIAALTQLGSDHLDYHKDLQNYAAAKAKLFSSSSLQTLVLNLGDNLGRSLYEKYQLKTDIRIISYALQDSAVQAMLRAKPLLQNKLDFAGSNYTSSVAFSSAQGERKIAVKTLGDFNLENLLTVWGILTACGIAWDTSLAQLAQCSSPPGRMQCFVVAAKPMVVVDYAHTAAALEKALQTLRQLTSGRLFVVFGCGGLRDVAKRSQMAAAACKNADMIIFTNDNPRGEPAENIIADMQQGVAEQDAARVRVCYDRVQAIAEAIAIASDADMVLVAGKGAETTQDLGGKLVDFSDIEVVKQCLGV